MAEQLYSLAYFSENAIAGNRDCVDAEIEAILASARAKNGPRGLTGALLYSAGYFAQVLEGEQEPLEALTETIMADPRHRNPVIIHYHAIAARGFGYWHMNYVHANWPESARADTAAASRANALGQHFLWVLYTYIRQNEGG